MAPKSRRVLGDVSKTLDATIHVVLKRSAFIPYSTGPRVCVGKNLALNELRTAAAFIVQRFDMEVAPGFDLNSWEMTLQDLFMLRKGALPVVLSARA